MNLSPLLRDPKALRAAHVPERKCWVKKHPLVSLVAGGAGIVAVSILFLGTTPQREAAPDKEKPGLYAGQSPKEKRASEADILRNLLKGRRILIDAGRRSIDTLGPEGDFAKWEEGLSSKTVSELRTIWRTQEILMARRAMELDVSSASLTELAEGGRKAIEAKRIKDAASREIIRRRKNGEEIPGEVWKNTDPEPKWLGTMKRKSAEELSTLWDEEQAAKADAIEYFLDAVEIGDTAEEAEAFTDFREADKYLMAIQKEVSARVRSGELPSR